MRLFRTYKPLQFFGMISVVLSVIAAIIFIPILTTYAQTGLVPRFPTLIVCGFMVVAAIQSFFGGAILDINVRKNRQDFEFNYQTVLYQKKQLTENKENSNLCK